jgi:glycosyltransferase involved in cell wall biosynthesis
VKIALCTPFKPLDHTTVSGDVTIVRDLAAALRELGSEVIPLPHFSAKEIWKHPSRWLPARRALDRMVEAARGADLWLTYGSYYKVPDVFGPDGAARLDVPYCLVQASYAPKRGKKLATWPGFRLNRRAMLRADHLFCNRLNDLRGCSWLLPSDRYTHIRPGLPAGLLTRDEEGGRRLRESWNTGGAKVVATAAMMRAGVKAEGLRWVFRTCADLLSRRRDLFLAVAGDGPLRRELEGEAGELLGDRVIFTGMVRREKLGEFFAAADFFAFPGLKESVGMVYLEAQQCGLPVVATDDEGAPQVVAHDRTGLITGANLEAFTQGVDALVRDPGLCARLAKAAPGYVAEEHDARRNYDRMNEIMRLLVSRRTRS